MLKLWPHTPYEQIQIQTQRDTIWNENYECDKSEIVLNDYIHHMKMELYGRGETMIQVGAGSEGEDGDGQSQTFLY